MNPLILLVDDDSRFLRLLEARLSRLDVRVATASCARTALEIIRTRRPRLVLSDIQMPDVAGPALQREARRLLKSQAPPFIYLTGCMRDLDGKASGRVVFSKLGDARQLVARIEQALSAARQTRPAPRLDGLAEIGRLIDWTLRRRGYPLTKRAIDVALSALGLTLLCPLFIAASVAIRLEDGGPVFFSQVRVGRGGRRFHFYKFRSMTVDAESKRAAVRVSAGDLGVRFKLRNDPRITRVGALLRRTSIDELPQLWNVLRGDMSLVGPRPPIPEETARYDARIWHRLDVTPGLTCTWQVSGRSELPFEAQVDLDLDYIRCQTLARDLALIARTVPAVVTGRGAH